jgi:hypothetical protein
VSNATGAGPTSVTVLYPGRIEPFVAGPHRQVSLWSAVGVTTLSVTDPEVEHSGFANRWVGIERPGLSTLLRLAGGGLHKFRLRAMLLAPPGGDVEDALNHVVRGHAAMDAVTVAYGRLEAVRVVITELLVRSVYRQQGTNNITRAELEFEFTHRPDEPSQVLPAPVPAAAPPAPAPPAPTAAATPATSRSHTFRAGETLWELAITYYRDGNQWRRIADANGIRDPRRIAIGTVVTIP